MPNVRDTEDQQSGTEENIYNVKLPALFFINQRVHQTSIQQLIFPSYDIQAKVEAYNRGRTKGIKIIPLESDLEPILVKKNSNSTGEFIKVIQKAVNDLDPNKIIDLSSAKWIKHPKLPATIPSTVTDFQDQINKVLDSWFRNFSFNESNTAKSLKGLRSPQIGAVHAIHAHWSVTNDTATIVMPTGTGKTETMIATLISKPCYPVLIVVPTDALRTQIANKFLTLGMLKELEVIKDSTMYPIVGILKHKPRSIQEVDDLFQKCNVVITTMQIAGQCSEDIQKQIASHCKYLFIDEAHHTGAHTWKEFKKNFLTNSILQFTATPFRNDGKMIEGKIIFEFPLKSAQEQGYFEPITYSPVFEWDPLKIDIAIAEKAVQQLKDDRNKGLDHILMARVDNVDRAREIFKLYEQYEEFNPVQIHTGIVSKKDRDEIRKKIISKESRIVVCVDMLGEGFDLPELKVAAFHDVKKSLPATLQLVGRFTRTRSDLGSPTFIANAADPEVSGELKKLYAQNSDWNELLSQSSAKVTQEQINFWEFLEGFDKFPNEIPLQNIRPAMSTVVFKTNCENWNPENWREGFKGIKLDRVNYDINFQQNTLVIITARKKPIDWAPIKDIYSWEWELFIVIWDKDQQLLFVNSSSNQGYFTSLAKAVAGETSLIREIPIFRCFSGINRLKLQNVGLIELLGRYIRYIMRSGSDVELGMTDAQTRTVKKANMFGIGFENGEKTSIGCSYKGRIWSRKVTNIESLSRWCKNLGTKILDESINPDEVLKGTLIAKFIDERPNKFPVFIDWPELMYNEPESYYEIVIDDTQVIPLYEADIKLKDPSETGNLSFEIVSDTSSVEIALMYLNADGNHDYRFSVVGNHKAEIKHRGSTTSISEFFYENTPRIWFVDGSVLEGNSYTELNSTHPPYASDKIEVWDWTDVDIKKESQGVAKEQDSIQYKVIRELKTKDYGVIFDDDGAGEIGDVVAIRDEESGITIDIYHCKFSKELQPGGRIDDLYVVCGQAQKSVSWLEKTDDLLKHLQRRDSKRQSSEGSSRFEVGDTNLISTYINKLTSYPVNVRIFIVQPGLSKAAASTAQLHLLSVTESYLMDTYKLPLTIIASE